MNKVVKKSILFGLLVLIVNPTYPAFGMNIVSNIFTNMFSKVQEHPWLTVGTLGAIAVGIAGYRFCVRRINDLSTENLEKKKQTIQILEKRLKDKSIRLTFSQEENSQLDLAFQEAKNISIDTEPIDTMKKLDNIIEKIESASQCIRGKLITTFNNCVDTFMTGPLGTTDAFTEEVNDRLGKAIAPIEDIEKEINEGNPTAQECTDAIQKVENIIKEIITIKTAHIRKFIADVRRKMSEICNRIDTDSELESFKRENLKKDIDKLLEKMESYIKANNFADAAAFLYEINDEMENAQFDELALLVANALLNFETNELEGLKNKWKAIDEADHMQGCRTLQLLSECFSCIAQEMNTIEIIKKKKNVGSIRSKTEQLQQLKRTANSNLNGTRANNGKCFCQSIQRTI